MYVCMCVCMCIYIYMYMYTYTCNMYTYNIYIYMYILLFCLSYAAAPLACQQRPVRDGRRTSLQTRTLTAHLRTKILDFRGFDSSRILILWGGILRSIGNFPESLSQRILASRPRSISDSGGGSLSVSLSHRIVVYYRILF